MSNDIQKSLSLLRELSKQMEGKSLEVNTADRFNPFRFFRKDELGLSAILAFLLDPKETHGQGNLFLNSFLEKLNLHHFLAYDQVDVIVEKTTKNNRRHDIFIRGNLKRKPQWVFSIENKLNWAGDQKDQVKDYFKDLKSYSTGNNYYLMYLPVEDCKPSSYSISEEEWDLESKSGNATIWHTKLIIEWLNEIKVRIVSPDVQSFISFFVKYLEGNVMNKKEYSNLSKEIISLGKNNREDLRMFMNILNCKDEIIEVLVETLRSDLEEKFYGLDDTSNWVIQKYINSQCFNISFVRNDEWNDFNIKLSFSKNGFQGFYFGIAYDSDPRNLEKDEDGLNKYERLFTKLPNFLRENKNNWWECWEYFKNNQNWTSETWARIPDGELAKEIWQEIEELCKAVTQLNYSK